MNILSISLHVIILLVCIRAAFTNSETDAPSKSLTMDLKMPGARPKVQDSYICSSFDISQQSNSSEIHVTGFEATADATKAHHMLLYSCNDPLKPPGEAYDCFDHTICKDSPSIMFGWAKNAPPANLPNQVSFKASTNKRRYFVLQVHYKDALPDPDYSILTLTYQTEETKYQAGIFLLLTNGSAIPPNTPVTHADANCKIPSENPLHMFAYRTHAHTLGSVITGYIYNQAENSYREVARGNPQWPQAFYPMNQVETVNPGEFLTARCTFNSTGRNRTTYIGPTVGDEMCNLYIMFYTKPGEAQDYLICANEKAGSKITRGLPKDSDTPLSVYISFEDLAKDEDRGSHIDLNYEKDIKGSTENQGIVLEKTMLSYNVTMPGVKPTHHDDSICTSYSMKKLSKGSKLWINDFSTLSTSNNTHHMLLSRCETPGQKTEGETWDCREHSLCHGLSKVIYAWGKGAESIKLPENVAFNIEPNDYLVLQVQYEHPSLEPDNSGFNLTFTSEAPIFTAGIYILFRTKLHIPANTPDTHVNINCTANISNPIRPFAYRIHAHSLGTTIAGYKYTPSIDHWTLLGKSSPRKPEAFYRFKTTETIYPGDNLTATCSYNSTGVAKDTKLGTTMEDEMCNFYLMYYTESENEDFKICASEADNKQMEDTEKLKDTNDRRNELVMLVGLMGFLTVCFICFICIRQRKQRKHKKKGFKGINGIRYEAIEDLEIDTKGNPFLSTDSDTDDEVFSAIPKFPHFGQT